MAQERKLSYEKRWKIIGDLGQGGQGRVYRVRDEESNLSSKGYENALRDCIQTITTMATRPGDKETAANDLLALLRGIAHDEREEQLGALKVLHHPSDARDADRAAERIAREIRAMSSVSHPSLLEILDHNEEEQWYVSRFYAQGPLSVANAYKGDAIRALHAFRGLVDGVAQLHERGYVHRDIKPHNVFLSEQGELVLGDFGLVFFCDDQRTRLSGTFENVGSRDWMPGWAYSMRVEEVRSSFDVFSLGKVLWSMVAGSPVLPLWYFNKPEYDLEKRFAEGKYITLVNRLLSKTIVEEEQDCLPNASELLTEVDRALRIIDAGADYISAKTVRRACRVCGVGEYALVADRNDRTAAHNFGLDLGRNEWRIFGCQNCGHVQLFAFGEGISPKAWDEA